MSPEHLENIPTEMKVLDRWLCCEKGSKAPTNAKTGKAGSSTNSNTWSSFECVENRIQSGAFAHIGIALNGDGLVAVDLDHCVENGIPNPKAIALLEEMGATYIEFSKSGNGLHAYGYAEQLDIHAVERFPTHGCLTFGIDVWTPEGGGACTPSDIPATRAGMKLKTRVIPIERALSQRISGIGVTAVSRQPNLNGSKQPQTAVDQAH